MSRRIYTDEDKARGFLALTVHDGNLKRAARETGLPESTLRRWREEWAQGVPTPVIDGAVELAEGFVNDAERVRDAALREIERKIPEAKPSELITIVGVLDDKITRARGLATSRTAVQHELPPPEQIRDALVAAMQGALEASRERQAVIVDAEVVVEPAQKALPAG